MRTEADAIELLYSYLCSQFPKTCNRCNHVYPTLLDYISKTEPLPQAISYDIDLKEDDDSPPIGAAAFAYCVCGNTLNVGTADLPVETRLELIAWAREEVIKRKWTPEEFLNYMRGRLRARARASAG